MAYLPEKSIWEDGIYQLETSDPVLAGPDGIDNLQGKQLANRTVHLRDRIAKLESGEKSSGNAIKLSTARKIEVTGDGSWNVMFDGSGNVSGALTLANTPVTPGTWAMTTVDAKGRVTAGRALAAGDVPALDWSKITSGKPATLDGYGITDAQPASPDLAALANLKGAAGLYVNTGPGSAVVRCRRWQRVR